MPAPRSARCGADETSSGLEGPATSEGTTLTSIDDAVTTDQTQPGDPAQATFEDLGVCPEIVQALERVGITNPFPIQALSIPIAIQGTDMIGQARTGTGKTLAFGISLLQRITVPTDPGFDRLPAPGRPQALVMCPTRELALQVARDLEIAPAVRPGRGGSGARRTGPGRPRPGRLLHGRLPGSGPRRSLAGGHRREAPRTVSGQRP